MGDMVAEKLEAGVVSSSKPQCVLVVSSDHLNSWESILCGEKSCRNLFYQSSSSQIFSVKFSDSLQELEKYAILQGMNKGNVFTDHSSAALAIALAIRQPKLVKRLFLLNPELSSESFSECLLRNIDAVMPLGLPFRNTIRRQISANNVVSSLHRIAIPTLIVTTSDATPVQRRHSLIAHHQIPSSWLLSQKFAMSEIVDPYIQEVNAIISKFLTIPSKRPQKSHARKS